MAELRDYKYETLKVTKPAEFVYNVELNRPEKLNAMNVAFWKEMVECFKQIIKDSDCRVVIISAAGRIFTAGLDLTDSPNTFEGEIARTGFHIRRVITEYQETFTILEQCPKPVLVAVHGACVGGGVNLITAADIRFCTRDAYFVVKEIDLGIAADVGVLQRLPKVIGNDSLARELCYTGRKLMANEAKECGLVSQVFDSKQEMITSVIETASLIASKSPVGVQGAKVNLVYSRDHSVADGLEFVAAWNQTMAQSEDFQQAVVAGLQKKKTTFSKL